jgi:hypothetical protein
VVGARPTATVAVDGQPPLQLGPAAKAHTPRSLGSAQGAAKGAPTGKPGSAASGPSPRAAPAGQAAGQLLVAFERLLLEKKDAKTLTLANTSVLPIKWRITGA